MCDFTPANRWLSPYRYVIHHGLRGPLQHRSRPNEQGNATYMAVGGSVSLSERYVLQVALL